VLLVLGGTETEASYFGWVKKSLDNSGLQIDIEGQGWNPEKLYNRALTLKAQDERTARRDGDPKSTYERVWVVTDVDEFVDDIRRIAPRSNKDKIQVSISNPCFEVWLNMHHDASAAPLDRFQAQRRAKELGVVDPTHPKRIVFSTIEGRFDTAETTAIQLNRRHVNNGTDFPHNCPSTTVHDIVRFLITKASGSKAKETAGSASPL